MSKPDRISEIISAEENLSDSSYSNEISDTYLLPTFSKKGVPFCSISKLLNNSSICSFVLLKKEANSFVVYSKSW
ncbi:MAG: hypothetical protein V3V41_04300 [Candidatus Heimdallarchaeota archaeon]